MKTKTNALALFISNEDIINWLLSKNLNLREDLEEKIEFIKKIQWKTIILHWYSAEDDTCTVSEYEKGKKYILPIELFEADEAAKIQEIEEVKDVKKNNILDLHLDTKVVIIWLLIIITICSFGFNIKNSKWNINESSESSEFSPIFSEIEEINKKIQNELENQKKVRQIEKESIQAVTQLEKKLKELRAKALIISNE